MMLLYHIICDMQSTASTASRNSLNLIIPLNFKEQGWDVGWLHTTFDALVATLKASQEALNSQSQLLYLVNSCRTNPEMKTGWLMSMCLTHGCHLTSR